MRFVGTAFLATTILMSSTTLANADVKVIASIKPVHSLVAAVMEGVGNPELLVEGAGSPHTYSLKPSQANKLQEADLVFWMSHDLEAFLENSIESIAKNAKAVSLMDAHDLIKLNFREGGAFDAHDHDDHEDHDTMTMTTMDTMTTTDTMTIKTMTTTDTMTIKTIMTMTTTDTMIIKTMTTMDTMTIKTMTTTGMETMLLSGREFLNCQLEPTNGLSQRVDGAYADPAMKMAIVASNHIEDSEEAAEAMLESENTNSSVNNDVLRVSDKVGTLNFDDTKDMTIFTVKIEKDGAYTFFIEHMPFEFEASEHFFKDLAGMNVERSSKSQIWTSRRPP